MAWWIQDGGACSENAKLHLRLQTQGAVMLLLAAVLTLIFPKVTAEAGTKQTLVTPPLLHFQNTKLTPCLCEIPQRTTVKAWEKNLTKYNLVLSCLSGLFRFVIPYFPSCFCRCLDSARSQRLCHVPPSHCGLLTSTDKFFSCIKSPLSLLFAAICTVPSLHCSSLCMAPFLISEFSGRAWTSWRGGGGGNL